MIKFCHVCSWLRNELAFPLIHFFIKHCQPHKLTITAEGMTMDVVVGKTGAFTVVATNSGGQTVPDTNITVTSDNPAVATATVNTDGSGGVVTGVSAGTANLTATDGTITSAPFPINVTQDLTVTTLTITPA
jgi:uncharacterized protein YjdB